MRTARRLKLAQFLISRAIREDQTAAALERMRVGDPEPTRARARIFRELAEYLESLPPDDVPEPQDGSEASGA
jgi:hypothetical protein